MIYSIVGILVGVIIGLLVNYSIPIEYIKYTAVIIVGILDVLSGAIKAEVKKSSYSVLIFLTTLLSNTILAFGITLLGEKLGIDLYLAVAVVFTFRIFENIGTITQVLLEKLSKKHFFKRIKK